jgi:hypothetical protein
MRQRFCLAYGNKAGDVTAAGRLARLEGGREGGRERGREREREREG